MFVVEVVVYCEGVVVWLLEWWVSIGLDYRIFLFKVCLVAYLIINFSFKIKFNNFLNVSYVIFFFFFVCVGGCVLWRAMWGVSCLCLVV